MTDRKLTIQPKGVENVFGCIPWIIRLPKSNGACEGLSHKYWAPRPCKGQARWAYADLQGDVEYLCFSHVYHGHLDRDDEQERLKKWMKQVNYYGFDNEATITEEEA